jgi:hypothetical protein
MRASRREHAAPPRHDSLRAAASLLIGALLVGAGVTLNVSSARADSPAPPPAAPATVPAKKLAPPTVTHASPAPAKATVTTAATPSAPAKAPAVAARTPVPVHVAAAPPKANPVPAKVAPAMTRPTPAMAAEPAPARNGPVPAKPAAPAKTPPAHPAGVPAAPASAAPSAIVPARPAVKTPTLPPAPALEERVTYQYNALGRRDPFVAMVGGTFVGDDVGGDAPPDIGGMKVVGIVWGADDKFALIEDARGTSGVLRAGDKVMNGVVETLRRDAVVVKLTVDGQMETVAIPLTRKGDQTNANR